MAIFGTRGKQLDTTVNTTEARSKYNRSKSHDHQYTTVPTMNTNTQNNTRVSWTKKKHEAWPTRQTLAVNTQPCRPIDFSQREGLWQNLDLSTMALRINRTRDDRT